MKIIFAFFDKVYNYSIQYLFRAWLVYDVLYSDNHFVRVGVFLYTLFRFLYKLNLL